MYMNNLINDGRLYVLYTHACAHFSHTSLIQTCMHTQCKDIYTDMNM